MSNPNHDNLGRFSSGAQALGRIAPSPGDTFTESEFATEHGKHHFRGLAAMQASGHVSKVMVNGAHIHQGNSGLYVRTLKPLPTIQERIDANNTVLKRAKAVAMIKKQGHTGQADVIVKAADDHHQAKMAARAAKQKAMADRRASRAKEIKDFKARLSPRAKQYLADKSDKRFFVPDKNTKWMTPKKDYHPLGDR